MGCSLKVLAIAAALLPAQALAQISASDGDAFITAQVFLRLLRLAVRSGRHCPICAMQPRLASCSAKAALKILD